MFHKFETMISQIVSRINKQAHNVIHQWSMTQDVVVGLENSTLGEQLEYLEYFSPRVCQHESQKVGANSGAQMLLLLLLLSIAKVATETPF